MLATRLGWPHDVGTCTTTGFPDVVHTDQDGNPRYPCGLPQGATCTNSSGCAGFDTPTLRGIASSPPYLHDGSAPTLIQYLIRSGRRVVVSSTLGMSGS